MDDLQAFQMSVSSCLAFPAVRMLRQQLLLRLKATCDGGRMADWYNKQAARCLRRSPAEAKARRSLVANEQGCCYDFVGVVQIRFVIY